MNVDDLVRLAAEALKMPESMVRQSAEARSKATGRTVEELLGEWAGVDPASEAPPRAETPDAVPTPSADAPAPAVPAAPAAAPAAPSAPSAPAAPAAPPVDAADLLTKAAAAQGLPEAMTKRSAAARAKAEGKTLDEILAEWAGVELAAGGAAPAAAAAPAASEAEAPPAAAAAPASSEAQAPPAAAPAAPAVDAADLLAKAAAAQGLPEAMTKRSAAARAKAEGKTPEQVLAEWAGVEAPAAGAAPAAPAAPAVSPAAAAPAAAEAPAAEIEVIAEESGVTAAEAARRTERELVTPSGAFPRWLAALFVAVPMFAITYASFLPNGPNCGDAGSLGIDPVTGIAVNCDGSEFGQDEVDFFAIGAEVYGARCAVCHGPTGGGVASFPPFIDGALLETFPEGSCATHIEWVMLGSAGWPDPTYGANNKPVGGLGVVMPAFGTQLSEQELHSVVLYERVQFGGLPLEGVITDCGLDAEEEAG
ncbi:MAG: c-type cytochrome [Acidimicrobiia bacterium]